MDGALSSSRYGGPGGRGDGGDRPRYHHHNNRRGGRRGGRGGRGGRRYGGNRRHHHHHPYRRNNNNHHHHHHNNNNNNNRNRQSDNRFSGNSSSSGETDPILVQLSAMVSRVGETKTPTEPDAMQEQQEQDEGMRPLIQITSKNIHDLSNLLSAEKHAAMFLRFEKDPASVSTPNEQGDNNQQQEQQPPASANSSSLTADALAGTLGHLVVCCTSCLPLQTPAYAGLTLAIEEKAPKPDYAGFADRAIKYTMKILGHELDEVLLVSAGAHLTAQSVLRIKLLLRYLALLAKVHLVQVTQNENDDDCLQALLQNLVQAAIKLVERGNNMTAATILSYIVLSTIPYLFHLMPREVIASQLMEPIETTVLEEYKSAYKPGIGSSCLLLKSEQMEQGCGDDDDDEDDNEEDEDDEDEGESSGGQCCDSFQDLFRCIKRMMQSTQQQEENGESNITMGKCALFTDAPWKGLGEEGQPLTFSGAPLPLTSLSQVCKVIPLVLSGDDTVHLTCQSLDGIIFGRLPIFGNASGEDGEDNNNDDDEDMEEEEEDDTPPNENLQAYQKEFGLLDRFFLGDMIRDSLITHVGNVMDTGLERGSAKDTAEQVWSVISFLKSGSNKGVEYPVIECLLSIILHSASSLRSLYVSRVLLELTRLQPSIMPQALALAVSNLVNFYMPSLVPCARIRLGLWFAFHLTNTDYQWPKGYWNHWFASYLEKGGRNSRADFIICAWHTMLENTVSVRELTRSCLAEGSKLPEAVLTPMDKKGLTVNNQALNEAERDVCDRVTNNENPELLAAHVVGNELAESTSQQQEGEEERGSWWRTGIVTRSLLFAIRNQWQSIKNAFDEDNMEHQEEPKNEDVLVTTTEALVIYETVLKSAMKKDGDDLNNTLEGEGKKQDDELTHLGGCHMVRQVLNATHYSFALMDGCLGSMVENSLCSPKAVFDCLLSTEYACPQSWWTLGVTVFRIGLGRAEKESNDASDFGVDGMVIDREGNDNPEEKRRKRILDFAQDEITNCLKRVCLVLASLAGGKKLMPQEVDLVEGFKLFVQSAQSLVLKCLEQQATGEEEDAANARKSLTESNLMGPGLAQICRDVDSSSPAMEVLIASLEGMNQ